MEDEGENDMWHTFEGCAPVWCGGTRWGYPVPRGAESRVVVGARVCFEPRGDRIASVTPDHRSPYRVARRWRFPDGSVTVMVMRVRG